MPFLNSWKEIAAYLGRSVRTVQRWEVELGLPVHHPRNQRRGPVMAVASEIDAWLRSTTLRRASLQPAHTADLCLTCSALKDQIELLRQQLHDNLNRGLQLARPHQHKSGAA